MKIAVVTDSTAYLPEDLCKRLDIHVVPLVVTIDGQDYDEEIDMTTPEFYDKVRGDGPLPKTSQPSVGEFAKKFKELSDAGAEAIVSVHLSSGISGTYAGALQAGQIEGHVDVRAFDSEISCYMQGYYAIRAAKRAQEGVDIDAIMAELTEMKQTMRAYFMVDDLSHLQRGGRLSSAQALIGGLLQVKPILHFVDKVIVPFEKIRTRKKAMKRIVNLLAEDAEKMPLEASIIHGNCPEEAERWLEELTFLLPDVEFTISHFGPVIGTHLGEGAMGLGWVKRKN